ncbi:MAG: molybdopterin-dependent oxidoreductase [Sulfolobales archaeon]
MSGEKLPPGQREIPRLVIYAEFGIPEIDLKTYRLVVEGLVRNRISLSYNELRDMIDMEYTEDFHCVAGWSVRNIKWRGVSMKRIFEISKPLETASYVYLTSLDGYSTIVDIETARDDRSLLVLDMNEKPLSIEHGFPVRFFSPKLYGWKSAKWLHKIIFINKYIDGYWETRGYHKRGCVWSEERFKSLI